jgi:hypothetical protein
VADATSAGRLTQWMLDAGVPASDLSALLASSVGLGGGMEIIGTLAPPRPSTPPVNLRRLDRAA